MWIKELEGEEDGVDKSLTMFQSLSAHVESVAIELAASASSEFSKVVDTIVSWKGQNDALLGARKNKAVAAALQATSLSMDIVKSSRLSGGVPAALQKKLTAASIDVKVDELVAAAELLLDIKQASEALVDMVERVPDKANDVALKDILKHHGSLERSFASMLKNRLSTDAMKEAKSKVYEAFPFTEAADQCFSQEFDAHQKDIWHIFSSFGTMPDDSALDAAVQEAVGRVQERSFRLQQLGASADDQAASACESRMQLASAIAETVGKSASRQLVQTMANDAAKSGVRQKLIDELCQPDAMKLMKAWALVAERTQSSLAALKEVMPTQGVTDDLLKKHLHKITGYHTKAGLAQRSCEMSLLGRGVAMASCRAMRFAFVACSAMGYVTYDVLPY